jgi:hypothetical protein
MSLAPEVIIFTGKNEEDPRRHLVRVLQALEVELSDAHGHRVLDGPYHVTEILHAVFLVQCYETFSVRNLRIFVISLSACPWQAFPALSNDCG